MGGCFCKKDFLMSYAVVVVSFGFLSMFGVLIPTGIATLRAIQLVFNQFNVSLLMLDLRYACSMQLLLFFFLQVASSSVLSLHKF